MNLGDVLATVAQPIARGIDAVAGTNIAECSGCKKMRDNLNQGMSVTDAIYERWFKAKQEGGQMKYQMTVVVDGDRMSDVAAKGESIGEVIAIQARPAPQPIRIAQPPQQ